MLSQQTSNFVSKVLNIIIISLKKKLGVYRSPGYITQVAFSAYKCEKKKIGEVKVTMN